MQKATVFRMFGILYKKGMIFLCTSQITKERIKLLCRDKKISMEKMLDECSLGINAIRQINDKKGMASFSLAKIADYLNCSVDYLLGRTDQPSYTASITGDKNVIQQGSINNSPVNFNTNAQLNEIETELINILRTFTVKQKMKLLNYAYDIKENDI